MNAAEILRAARAKIDAPEKWTKGESARDASGRGVFSNSPAAVCFCSIGAIGNIIDSTPMDIFRKAIGCGCISDWNDHKDRTHADVLAAFDKAIALAVEEVAT